MRSPLRRNSSRPANSARSSWSAPTRCRRSSITPTAPPACCSAMPRARVWWGGAAGAFWAEPSKKYGIIDTVIHSDGAGMPHLHQKAGGSRMPSTAETVAKRLHSVHQEGPAVYKFSLARMADVATELMQRNRLTSDQVDWLVPHQANRRIIEATAERMKLDPKQVMVTIHKYGNTTAATIPLCLWDYESKLRAGDRMILAAFGGGFTWGGVYMTWAYGPA